MYKLLVILTIILLVLYGSYFVINRFKTEQSQQKATQPPELITIGTSLQPGYSLIFISKNKKYFEREGLNVTYKIFPTGSEALNEALMGSVDIASVYETPVVRAKFEGKNVRVISTLHYSSSAAGLIARGDKGISTISDLKGRKIAVSKGNAYEFFLDSYLTSNGIKLSDVIIVYSSYAESVSLFKEGKVDAAALGNPWLYELISYFPKDSIVVFKSDIYKESAVLAGREDIIINKKQGFIKLLRGLAKAEQLYKTNNHKALESVISEFSDIPEESIRDTWDQYKLELKLNNVLLTIMDREARWFKTHNVYQTEIPDFSEVLLTDYLKEVKPEAVTVY